MTGRFDLINGRPLPLGDDEPVRQAVEARLLKLGYAEEQVEVDALRELTTPTGVLRVVADLLVSSGGRPGMVLRCARGSVITREKEVVATARLIRETWVPLAVATNSRDAELIATASGQVLAQGREAIPSPQQLADRLAPLTPHRPTPEQIQRAARVYAAFSQFHCQAYCR